MLFLSAEFGAYGLLHISKSDCSPAEDLRRDLQLRHLCSHQLMRITLAVLRESLGAGTT